MVLIPKANLEPIFLLRMLVNILRYPSMDRNPNHDQLFMEFHIAQVLCSNGPVKLKLIVLALFKGFLNLEGLLTNLLDCLAAWTSINIIVAHLKAAPRGQWE